MANFDQFKQKAWDTANTIADVSIELYKFAEKKAKKFSRKTRLATEIAKEKGNIRTLYSEIGKQYYARHKDDPESEFAQACSDISKSFTRIRYCKEEIERIKSEPDEDEFCGDCDADGDIEVEIITEDPTTDASDPEDTADDGTTESAN